MKQRTVFLRQLSFLYCFICIPMYMFSMLIWHNEYTTWGCLCLLIDYRTSTMPSKTEHWVILKKLPSPGSTNTTLTGKAAERVSSYFIIIFLCGRPVRVRITHYVRLSVCLMFPPLTRNAKPRKTFKLRAQVTNVRRRCGHYSPGRIARHFPLLDNFPPFYMA